MKVVMLEVGKEPYVREIKSTLEAEQEAVGGWIEVAYPPTHTDNAVIICNEEGKLKRLPPNVHLKNEMGIPYDVICGDCFIVNADPYEEDFTSLTDKQCEYYVKKYTEDRV